MSAWVHVTRIATSPEALFKRRCPPGTDAVVMVIYSLAIILHHRVELHLHLIFAFKKSYRIEAWKNASMHYSDFKCNGMMQANAKLRGLAEDDHDIFPIARTASFDKAGPVLYALGLS